MYGYRFCNVIFINLYSESEIPRRRFGFSGREDITISLLFNRPNADLLVSELSSITIWCEPFNAFFGRLDDIPAELTSGILAVSYLNIYSVIVILTVLLIIGWPSNGVLYSTSQ